MMTTVAYNVSTTVMTSSVGHTSGQERALSLLSYWINGILTNLVVLLGLIGNLLTIIILSQKAMRSSTNYYLSALAVWDSIVLLSSCLLIGLPGAQMQDYTEHVHGYVISYLYPLALIAQTATIWLTVSFTIERYIAVCHPLKAASMCTISRAKIVIVGVSLGSAFYNVPRWFDYRPTKHLNRTTNETITYAARTEFSQNPLYLKVYFSWLYVPMMVIVPLLVLSILNTFLILAVKRSRRQRKDMNVRQSRENNITIMLVSVVIVFIICQVPALVYNLAFAINNRYVSESFGYAVLSDIRNFLVSFNSAINFILYCALGQKFRRIFLHIFFRRCVQETYHPVSAMSHVHHHHAHNLHRSNNTTLVALASHSKGRVVCRTTINSGSSSTKTTGTSELSAGGAHCAANSNQSCGRLNSSQQDTSLIGGDHYHSATTYGTAYNKDKRKVGGSGVGTGRCRINEECEEDASYDSTLEHLLSTEKNHSQRNAYPMYKTSLCTTNRKMPT